ncbi:MAG: creatininase family protein [Gemmataceae bacterium]|nr:creatininase family protein [Gemmataceae bacterium]
MKFAEMTFPKLRQVPRDGVVVVFPIAACEQHSRHLAVLTDTVLVTGVADGVEAKLPAKVLQLPTLWLGASHHHLRFGATLSVGVDTHVDLIAGMLEPLLEDGYLRLLVLNGHGGNIDTMQMALRRLQPKWRERILSAASYWDLASKELAALAEGKRKGMGHACEFETSMMMHLRPDLVVKDQIEDDPLDEPAALRGLFLADDMMQKTDHGAVGYPSLATAEKGKRFLDAAIARTAETVEALLARLVPK